MLFFLSVSLWNSNFEQKISTIKCLMASPYIPEGVTKDIPKYIQSYPQWHIVAVLAKSSMCKHKTFVKWVLWLCDKGKKYNSSKTTHSVFCRRNDDI
jgi:hypothetical protein